MCVCLCDFETLFLRNQKHSVSIGCTYCWKQSRLILPCLVSEYIAKHIKMFMWVCTEGLWHVCTGWIFFCVVRWLVWCMSTCLCVGLAPQRLESCCEVWADSAVPTCMETTHMVKGKHNLLSFQHLVMLCLASWRTWCISTHLQNNVISPVVS